MAKQFPSSFSELNYDVLHHGLRVFIQGVEVTQDIMGSLSVRYEKNASPNHTSFQLDNALDKYYLTTVNLPNSDDPFTTVFSDDRGKYSEIPKRDIYNFKIVKKTQEANSAAIPDVFNKVLMQQTGTVQSTPNEAQVSSVYANAATLNTIVDLTTSVVANLPNSFFLNPGSDDGQLVISPAQASSTAGLNPNLNSANNTVAILTQQLNNTFPGVSQDANYLIAKDAVQRRMHNQTSMADNPVPIAPEKLNPKDPYTGSSRWEFHPGDCVLTQLDPVVVFATNPLASPEDDEWMCVFTGFLSDLSEAKDHLTGESKLSIVAQDIRFLMSKMRVASNTITGIKRPETVYLEQGSLFEDIIADTGGRTVQFSGKNFDDTLSWILTGVPSISDAIHNTTTTASAGVSNIRGVGSLFMRQRVTYPPEGAAGPPFQHVSSGSGAEKYDIPVPSKDTSGPSAKMLENWHTFALLGGQTQGNTSSYTGKFLSYAECTAIGSTSHTGNSKNDPLNRGVNLLLPRDGTKLTNIVQFGITKAGQDSFNFRDRLDIVTKIVETINYVFYVAPHGDLMIEFPFYDFIVEDFGDWGKVFSYDKHLISSSTVLEKPDITTGVVVTGGFAEQRPTDVPGNATIDKNNTVVVTSPKLASRYGSKTENVSFPFSYDKKDLAAYGTLKLQEALGNANSLTMQTVFRPFLLPNRPIQNVEDGKMGLTRGVENSWNIFELCTTSYDLHYIRTRQPVSVNPDEHASADKIDSWRFLTGGCVMGVSFRYAEGISGAVQSADNKFDTVAGNKVSGFRIVSDPGAVSDNVSGVGTPAAFSVADNSALAQMSQAERDSTCTPDGKITGVATTRLQPSAKTALQNIVREACVKMYVTSAVRNEEENTRVHGSPTSAHLSGFAWDARLRDPKSGNYVYTDDELTRIQQAAQHNGYRLLNETDHLHFEPNRSGKPPWFQKLPTAAQRALDKSIAEQKKLANTNRVG